MFRCSTPLLRRISLAILGWHVLASPCLAEVPWKQAMGLYAATPKDHRDLSPFWGMVAVRTGILANIRFFGAYGSKEREGLPRPAILRDPHYQCPQDPVAGVVEYLFPSRDGLILAHNQFDQDPIGRIAREAAKLRELRGKLALIRGKGEQTAEYKSLAHLVAQRTRSKGLWRIRALMEAVSTAGAETGSTAPAGASEPAAP